MKKYFWARAGSALLDISAIYCLAFIAQVFIVRFIFISFGSILKVVFIGYFFLWYYLFDGKSPGKVFAGIKITGKNGEQVTLVKLIYREIILKGLAGIILPIYLIERIPKSTNSLVFIPALLLVLFISVLFLLFFKQTWWERFSGTTTNRDKITSKAWLILVWCFLAILYISCISSSVYPLVINRENLFTRLPAPYPQTKELKRYAGFLSDHAQDPVDYIYRLFDRYDIVVISERMHPEYSQYEFIFKLIWDKRFNDRVGNIFTECGSVSCQDSLDNYMRTSFKTKDDLNRATARLQRNSSAVWPLWNNTNLFDMFKVVHTLNSSLPDSSKISWYFTDLPVNWTTATHETYMKSYTTPKRDSLMAIQVIDRYRKTLSRQKKKKALVIMNTYHGYGLAPNGKNYFGSTTGYIMKALPGKVSNVMMNTVSMKYLWAFVPVADGKWDAAFEMKGNHPAGFTFAGSPFGDDLFDARFAHARGLTYKDVFTGLVFYTPLTRQFCINDFPGEFENAENELIKRAAVVNEDYVNIIKGCIEYQKAHPGNPYTSGPTKLPIFYNLVNAVMIPFLFCIFLAIVVILFFVRLRKMKITGKLQQS